MPERLFIPDSSDSVRCCRDFLYQRFPTAIYEKSLAPNGHKGKGNQMKIIKYEVNGKQIDIEVTEEFARQFEEMQAESKHQHWRNKKRKESSFDAMIESGYQAEDPNSNIEDLFIRQSDLQMLYKAIESLEPQQKWLIYQVFFCRRNQIEIARKMEIDPTAIRNRLRKIYAKLKKFLK